MTHRRFCAFGLAALAFAGLAAKHADATTATGPYYANPSWDQTLPATTRFIVLSNMNDQAVLDRETGLVWEQSPSASGFNWVIAQFHCNSLRIGGRLGWRLPTVQELASLMDPNASTAPTLPGGHPFSNVLSDFYWTASTWANDPTAAWDVPFLLNGVVSISSKVLSRPAWCVRGGPAVDPQ